MLFVVFCYGLLACDEEHSKHIFAYESAADKKVKKLVNGIIFYIVVFNVYRSFVKIIL